jgi:DNA-binding response OmpR family regulator
VPSPSRDNRATPMSAETILLLVEDEPLILMMTQDALEAAGYRVIAVGNVADAERALAGDSLAGLITDIQLGPGPDGWELAERARAFDPSLPVVYATANNAAQWPIHGVADSVLVQKPYSAAEIVASVAALLDRGTARG